MDDLAPQLYPRVDFDSMVRADGYEAFVSGQAQSDNPFRPGSALHTLWQEGWQEARDYHDPVLTAP